MMNLPSPYPLVCTPETLASWQGKSAASVHQAIKRGTIPARFVLRPSERVLWIDLVPYLTFLRDRRRIELEKLEDAESQRAAGTAT